MEPEHVATKLIEVLASIQRDSGYAAVNITGQTCPLNDLEDFDSTIWPVAIGMLATELGVTIPNDKNIFVAEDGKRRLTVADAATLVSQMANSNSKEASP